MATKRARPKRQPWSKEEVRELRAHSRSKSPVKEIARAMKRTAGALRQHGRRATRHGHSSGDVQLRLDLGESRISLILTSTQPMGG